MRFRNLIRRCRTPIFPCFCPQALTGDRGPAVGIVNLTLIFGTTETHCCVCVCVCIVCVCALHLVFTRSCREHLLVCELTCLNGPASARPLFSSGHHSSSDTIIPYPTWLSVTLLKTHPQSHFVGGREGRKVPNGRARSVRARKHDLMLSTMGSGVCGTGNECNLRDGIHR